MVVSATAGGRWCFIGGRITDIALFPAESSPFRTNRALHHVSAGARSPIARAVLEVVVTANAIGRAVFTGGWITSIAAFPAEARPFVANRAAHVPCAGGRRPIN